MKIPEVKARFWIEAIRDGRVKIRVEGVSPSQWLYEGDSLTICTPIQIFTIESFPHLKNVEELATPDVEVTVKVKA